MPVFDYLNYDRLSKREIHHHLDGGERALHQWIQNDGIEPALRLNDAQTDAFAQLRRQSGRDRGELLREALDDLLKKYRRKTSGTTR